MSRDRDPKTGQFTMKASGKDILRWMENHEDAAVTATEVAEAFDIDRATAKRRLDGLNKEELVERKEVGARAVIWWPSEGEKA